MSELKPCPFCGGHARIFRVNCFYYEAQCNVCGNRTAPYKYPETAIAAWNRRIHDEQ